MCSPKTLSHRPFFKGIKQSYSKYLFLGFLQELPHYTRSQIHSAWYAFFDSAQQWVLKDCKKQGKYRGCLPLVHPTQPPTMSQWLRHAWAWKRHPDHHSLTMVLPFQEFAQLLFWFDLDFHPSLQPMVKSPGFGTCPASPVCTDCLGFLQFLHLPFAPICNFSTAVTPLQLTLTQAKRGSAIRSIPSMEIFNSSKQYLCLQGPHLTF